ncbi:olfactory receptor 10A2-like [Ranitomeya variabilis]|uniref:olfactory receptor 10A2-like n=1 Tax=Ranitomeya variabilis TaxID=490064 RepID=UPI004055F6CF
MVHFIALPALPNAKTLVQVFRNEIVQLHSVPLDVVSDLGTQFVSKFWRAFCSLLGLQLYFYSALHPQSNGQTERINQNFETYLRCFVFESQEDYAFYLALAEFAINNHCQESTGRSPFFGVYSYYPQFVSISKNLHTPMYFFISQLSISDILMATNIVPKMLQILLHNGGTIYFIDCITQLYIFCASEAFDCLLLAVMSYDRYVAICNPLRYATIMTRTCCIKLAIISWGFGFSIALIDSITTAMLTFCGPNIIDHFFCDMNPVLDIACSDTSIVHLEITLLGTPSVIFPTIIIIISYAKIISAILKIPSSTGRQKAFSTCSSHLIVVSIFYWTMYSVYDLPTKEQTVNISKILSLLYTVFTPFINPII